MNKLPVLLVSLILFVLSASCKKEVDMVEPTPTNISKPGSSTKRNAGAVKTYHFKKIETYCV